MIAGPVALPTPVGARRIDVTTAAEMFEATQESVENADVLLMAAAVADFRPGEIAKEKIKRKKDVPEITLERTDDTNRVTLLDRDGGSEELPLMTKAAVAEEVLQRVVELMDAVDDQS